MSSNAACPETQDPVDVGGLAKLVGGGKLGLNRARPALAAGGKTFLVSAPTLLRTFSILAATVALGRSSDGGAAMVGQYSVLLAFAAVAQSVAVGGVSGAAMHKLINAPAGAWLGTVQTISGARFILLPAAYSILFAVYYFLVDDGSISPIALVFFFAGYAVGTYDVGELIMTSRSDFAELSGRRGVVILIIAIPKIYFASIGNLSAVLILQGLELALCQLVLMYSKIVPVMRLGPTRANVSAGVREISRVRLLWLSSVVAVLGMRIDVLLVAGLLGDEAAGQYSTASRLVEAASIIAAAVGTLALNDLSKHSKKVENYAAALTRNGRLVLASGALATCVSALLSPVLILLLYGEQFRMASELSIAYSATLFVIFFRQLISKIMIVESAFRLSLTSNLLSVVISVASAPVLIPEFGLWGAVSATLLAYYASVVVGLGLTAQGRSMLAGSLLAGINKGVGHKAAKSLIESR